MGKTISAIYQGGVLKPLEPLDLPEHQQVQLTVALPESELLREASRQYLRTRAGRRPMDHPRVWEAVVTMDELARQDCPVAGWDAVSAVRRDRQRRRDD